MGKQRIGTSKELKVIIKQAEQQGWEITVSRSCHLKWRSPEGALVVSGLTPSDWRATNNIISRLKRAGFVPTKEKHQ